MLEILSFEGSIEALAVKGSITLRFGSLEKIDADLKAKVVKGGYLWIFLLLFKVSESQSAVVKVGLVKEDLRFRSKQ